MKKVPSAVYRIQFSHLFTMKKACQLLPYLKKLGIDGIYCSPYFAAHSDHGYDIVDPNRLNQKIGSTKDYLAFCQKLKKLHFYHIVDLVPNHMGAYSENVWWCDVLEKGEKSKFASFFDIDWSLGKLLLPVLETSYEEALAKQEFKIIKKADKKFVKYKKHLFPLHRQSYKRKSVSIDAILQEQVYQFTPWYTSYEKVSYRRFFNINELVALCIENKQVMQAHHKWVFALLKTVVDGLRIDHPDGLYDPKGYFDRLRKKHKGLIVVEKILGKEEELPLDWSVDGTVGYEFLNYLTKLFIKEENVTKTYETFTHNQWNFEELLYQKKKEFILQEMQGDLTRLAQQFYTLNPKIELEDIKEGLCHLLACFPVYRSYIRQEGEPSKEDKLHILQAFTKASFKMEEKTFQFLESVFLLQIDELKMRECIMRFQQLSAPVMAKGLEDIVLYHYNRLLAVNEVGGQPEELSISVEKFHAFCKRKREKWPYGLLPNSTHDTKRSLDVRMQLAVLSEKMQEWQEVVLTWNAWNEKHKTEIENALFPDLNTEYYLYQTLLGVFPSKPSFTRLWKVVEKSLREMRTHTSWIRPQPLYEEAAKKFLKALLDKKSPFYHSFVNFQRQIFPYGKWNTLAAIALQLGAPGIIDIYEGCEDFRYVLVDPDNRGPVSFRKDSSKVELHRQALNFRKKHTSLFLQGDYIPLEVEGEKKEHVIAYLRTLGNKSCLVAALRFFTTLKDLKETRIILPKKMKEGHEIFSGKNFEGQELKASHLFATLPFAWLFWEEKRQKASPLS